jgi:NAD(P)-dependent dehydrogenase (short-subunit alcohol dehydrogenase family)
MDLSKARHAFITGGASGIGLAIADSLARRGVSITMADIDPDAVAHALGTRREKFRGVALDVRDRAGWAAAKREAEAAFGPVDILVNNAGIAPDGRMLADMDPASFDLIVGINLTGVFNGISAFGKDMRAHGHGHIVNTASMAGLSAIAPTIGGYTTSKYGVVGLSEILRLEMAPHGIGVSVLCPGLVATNLRDSTIKAGGRVSDPNSPMMEGGMNPAKVGEIVANGIAANQLYIITHPERWRDVEARHDAIRDAFLAAK